MTLPSKDEVILVKHDARAAHSGSLSRQRVRLLCVIAAMRSFLYHWFDRIKRVIGQ